MNSDWEHLLTALAIRVGDPVMVRSVDQGVSVGLLAACRGRAVALSEAYHLRDWSECGNTEGSCYDLLEYPDARIARSAGALSIIILEASDVTRLTDEQGRWLRGLPDD